MSTPLVSVVMPVYRVRRYVEAAARSVLRQSCSDLELIVVDDACPDGSASIVAALGDSRIRIVRHESNRGLAAARNTGLDAARGRFVALLDADDIAPPWRMQTQLRHLHDRPRVVLCGGHMRYIDEAGRPYGRVHRAQGSPALVAATLLVRNPLFVSSVMMRAEVARALRYRTDFRMAEDYEFYTRAVALGELGNVDALLLLYRVRRDSLTSSQPEEMTRCVSRIAADQLRALGLSPGARDLEIHRHLGFQHLPAAMSLLDEVDRWVTLLLEANSRTGLFQQAALQSLLSRCWFEVCRRAAVLGPVVPRRHARGNARAYGRGAGWDRYAKFLAAAVLRHP